MPKKNSYVSSAGLNRMRIKRASQEKGFALIATISVMVLLVMIALAMLSLSTIELRQSRNADARSVAQANAKLALMVALGQLQKTTGPDQRVTAPAALTGSGNHDNWYAVYKTTSQSGGNLPVIRLDSAGESLIDERSSVGNQDAYRLEWLVSGDNPDPGMSSAGGNMVEIVSNGSVVDDINKVRVPLQPINNPNGIEIGSMAYWVSDESTKARVDLYDRYASSQPGGGDQDSNGYRRFLSPEKFGVGLLDGMGSHDDLDEDNARRLLTVSQANLAGLDQDAMKEHFHSLTTASLGVFADTLRSGLRPDLSVFLEEGSIDSISGVPNSGINDNTPLLEGSHRSNIGPRMGILRSWAELADDAGSGSVPTIDPRGLDNVLQAGKYGKYPDLGKLESQPVHPVIAQASLTTRFSYIRGYLAVHLYPRIVLWNPYNVRLEASQYVIDFNHFVHDSMTVEKRDSSGTTDIKGAGYDTRNASNSARRMVLTTLPTSFGPGEALVFSPHVSGGAIGGNAMPLRFRTTGLQNLISATTSPSLMTNFYMSLGTLPGVSKADLPIYGNHNRGAYYWVDMMDWWWGEPDNGLKVGLHLLEGNQGNYNNLVRDHKLLQYIDTDHWFRGYQNRFNNGRWKVGGVEPIYDYESTPSQQPWARTHYGIRLKWMRETNPYNLAGGGAGSFWHAAHVANYNMRAALSHHSPFDTIADNGESHHWYNWGPYAVERQQALPYNHPDYAAHPGPNGYRANIFFAGSETSPTHTYPLFDVPGRNYQVHGIGAFRHAQLSQHIWQPSYAVGFSRAPINLFEREKTAKSLSAMKSEWQNELPHAPDWLRILHHSPSRADEDHFIYDLAYEANHALWDKYFLSSGNETHKRELIDDPLANSLPNSRVVPIAGATEAELLDGRRAASKLMLKGAFNINSADVDAWKALLASYRGVRAENSAGSSSASPDGYAFPRFNVTPGAPYNGGGPMDVEAWNGYRKLSDGELESLAEAIVEEVKERGPFVSISDFVNRRLVASSGSGGNQNLGLMGTLDAAIARTAINDSLTGGDAAMPQNFAGLSESYSVDTRSNPDHFPDSKAEGAPGWLMQGDILERVGSVLTARGDTFRVRAYGEAKDSNGNVIARAWCEAIVQRTPDYVDSTDEAHLPAVLPSGAENLEVSEINRKFGRRYVISSFRWLTPSEV